MDPLKILVIPGSTRTGSLNVQLAAAAIDELARIPNVAVSRISLVDYEMPIYDGDLEANQGVPPAALQLKRMIGSHHGVLIVTPEYNSSLPPLLKNAIDWVSRVGDGLEKRGAVFPGRAFAIAAASASRLGGMRCLMNLRQILSACNATVIPRQVALSFAPQAYDESDRLKAPVDAAALQAMVKQLVEFAQYMK